MTIAKYIHEIKISFSYIDVDMGKVMYYGHYNKYADFARCEILKMASIPLYNDNKETWQTVEIEISYKKPIKIEDELIIRTYLLIEEQDCLKYTHNFIVNDVVVATQNAKCILVDSNLNKIEIAENIINKLKSLSKKESKLNE